MAAKSMIDPEFKALIPPLSDEEYQQLEANILSCGRCRDAIILWNGIIIDGHNRFYICMKHGIEFEIKEMDFASREEARLWIIENQMGRRNLTDAMRIELALCKADMLKEKARANLSRVGGDRKSEKSPLAKSSKVVDEPVNVRKAIASEAAVGERTLHRYMQIKKDGSPALLEKVKSGEIKIGTAHKMLAKEIEKQLKQADKWYAYIAERAPFDRDDADDRLINDRLGALAQQLQGLLQKIDDKKRGVCNAEN
ncbi:MAG: hypothetical protein FWD03_03740 [Defluviitaleaceae bacterium]|nr:hypothetical protein [Defluviitaleaceae bacterium]